MPVGLANPTHTACHIATSIWMIYSVKPLRQALIELGQSFTASAVVRELGQVLESMESSSSATTPDSPTAINPKRLYRQLQYQGIADPNNPGDTSTTLSKLLTFLKEKHSLLDETILQPLLGSGRMRSTLKGVVSCGTETIVRSKQLAVKPIPCPWTVPADMPLLLANWSQASDSSNTNHVQETAVRDYQWNDDADVKEENRGQWVTTKTLHVEHLPPVLFLHLDRRQREPIEVPLHLDVPNYRLVAGVLLILDEDEDDHTGDDDENHVAAIVRTGDDVNGEENSVGNDWTLFDDESGHALTNDQARCLLSGCYCDEEYHRHEAVDANATYSGELRCARGVALVFISCTTDACDWIRFREEIAPTVMWDVSLVGRRLRVQWARGRWFTGRIAGYDDVQQQHKVTYDDGEVRWYDLESKAIEWLPP